MSISYQAKDSQVLGRQLEAQDIYITCDVVNETSDAPALCVIDSSTIADSTITVDVKETIEKVFIAQVLNATTGANVALEAVTVSGTTVELQVDGTSLTSACVHIVYKVAE